MTRPKKKTGKYRPVPPENEKKLPAVDTFHQTVADIQRILTRIAARHHLRPARVFDDWLYLTEAMLTMLPTHARSVARTGRLAPDPPDIAALFDRIRRDYPHLDPETGFARATALLLAAASDGFFDVVGSVYMAINAANEHAGQFFTPWPVAQLMADLLIGRNGPAAVIDRLRAAAATAASAPDAPPTLKASRLMGRLAGLGHPLPLDIPPWLADHWPLIAPHYQPLTIADPAVGSGALLLAAAERFPPWMLHLGLVQFFGTDIDAQCARMARINLKLYGLNGFGAKTMAALASPPGSFHENLRPPEFSNDIPLEVTQ